MRVLLDTHALLWWSFGDPRLSPRAREVIGSRENMVHVSAVSALEIAIKVRLGRLPNAAGFIHDFEEELRLQQFTGLEIRMSHARQAGLLAGKHRDPFDRLLAAQALSEGLELVSNDEALKELLPYLVW